MSLLLGWLAPGLHLLRFQRSHLSRCCAVQSYRLSWHSQESDLPCGHWAESRLGEVHQWCRLYFRTGINSAARRWRPRAGEGTTESQLPVQGRPREAILVVLNWSPSYPLSIIFDILEAPAFQKYSTCWVFSALYLCTRLTD